MPFAFGLAVEDWLQLPAINISGIEKDLPAVSEMQVGKNIFVDRAVVLKSITILTIMLFVVA